MFCNVLSIRVEQFAREEVDLKLGLSLDFDVPMTDLSQVRQMMDSINVLPGQTLTAARLHLHLLGSIYAVLCLRNAVWKQEDANKTSKMCLKTETHLKSIIFYLATCK